MVLLSLMQLKVRRERVKRKVERVEGKKEREDESISFADVYIRF